MPTRDFQRDLNEATIPGRFPHLTCIRSGEGDGSISFTYTDPEAGDAFRFEAIVSDPQDYPSTHTFFVYSTSESVPPEITKAVDEIVPRFAGSPIDDVLSTLDHVVSNAIQGSTPQSSEDVNGIALSSDQEFGEIIEISDWTDDEDGFFASTVDPDKLREKVHRDLRAVKLAGFKVGYHGDPASLIIVSVAMRISKMGISEEAMTAWNVRPVEYLVLLMRYSRYQTMEELYVGGKIQMRVGLCDSYKPSYASTTKAFQEAIIPNKPQSMMGDQDPGPTLRGLFIGTALDKLLNEQFLHIVRLRLKHGFSWTGAESFFHAGQGKCIGPDDASSPEFALQDTYMTPAPCFMQSDLVADMSLTPFDISFPLLTELFLLRHFVKCTEFCLVCHCKTNDSFEALKPYVCSNGLCLFQYMTLGIGPSLEYEIRIQPYVVDMLVSLAYARAKSGRLTDFPIGLGLHVPNMALLDMEPTDPYGSHNVVTLSTPDDEWKPSKLYEATISAKTMELSQKCVPKVKVGNWIVLLHPETTVAAKEKKQAPWHCRVQRVGETSGHITLELPLVRGAQLSENEVLKRYPDLTTIHYAIYDTNFDVLSEEKRRRTIVMLLETLPNVDSMLAFLGENESGRLLSSWHEMITPAALDLLRWIVASNRSCILQDGRRADHLVSEMDGYLQFRLVQGAPDKEQRFMEAVNQHSLRTKPAFPTIFAWHGSPVYNWHSILREGLHFREIAHGRAYGNGVYLSSHHETSMGYRGLIAGGSWPQSKLEIQSMISLNEIVNNPAEFVSTSPHYVVKNLDWIQPRYLFVQVGDPSTLDEISGRTVPSTVYEQDPISQRRQGLAASPRKIKTSPLKRKKKKRNSMGTSTEVIQIDDTASIATDIGDLTILLSDTDNELVGFSSKKKKKVDTVPETDFIPGTLVEASLPLMSPPAYATTPATSLLQRSLRATLKTQETEPLHELGWYVDPSLIKTVYQWIVELHTFDPSLPLTQDLKAANLTSVVLELRFPPQFPMDPPFVRIIRPRLLEFAHGGGGHVTVGGAICMELLTNSGWSAVTSIESLLLQVRLAISTKDHPARLAPGRNYDYSVGEAVAAYTRACRAHGWAIPKDMNAISW
ncbi:Ubiquitin-conjugating enzyme E2 Q2 [Penicillium rolfsii]|nr:Ubiquitin-conjugating enzyme E2 Q2 [Penicillium rolfsii]